MIDMKSPHTHPSHSDDTQAQAGAWRAVLARDRSQDGRFVYAVESTKIYCRPSCPSRRPLRRNVRFFPTPGAAQTAGYRACLRCRPDSGFGDDAQTDQLQASDRAVLAALAHLDRNPESHVSLEQLAAAVGLSPFHLQRQFKRRTGMTPKEYSTALRLMRFRRHVKAGQAVSEATYEAGFGSSRGLYTKARTGLGMTPAQYARGAPGRAIAYGLYDSELGRVLIASTDDGVCAVLLGESDDELESQLAAEFPKAELSCAPQLRAEWAQNVIRHLADTRLPLAVPLDHHGSPFQIRVWKALREIPAGERRSYSELAQTLGEPGAARAVGRACGQNAIAVLVPCHRVVRKDGGLGGYRWGLERKRRLLARENENA